MVEVFTSATRSKFLSIWAFRDKVYIDGDTSIKAVVTGFLFRETIIEQLQLEWFANGDAKSAWVESWRVSHAD